jgi:hypothetical protein
MPVPKTGSPPNPEGEEKEGSQAKGSLPKWVAVLSVIGISVAVIRGVYIFYRTQAHEAYLTEEQESDAKRRRVILELASKTNGVVAAKEGSDIVKPITSSAKSSSQEKEILTAGSSAKSVVLPLDRFLAVTAISKISYPDDTTSLEGIVINLAKKEGSGLFLRASIANRSEVNIVEMKFVMEAFVLNGGVVRRYPVKFHPNGSDSFLGKNGSREFVLFAEAKNSLGERTFAVTDPKGDKHKIISYTPNEELGFRLMPVTLLMGDGRVVRCETDRCYEQKQ